MVINSTQVEELHFGMNSAARIHMSTFFIATETPHNCMKETMNCLEWVGGCIDMLDFTFFV